MRTSTLRRTILSVVMIVLGCLVAAPLYFVLINTFKTQGDMVASPLGLPRQWTLSNYTHVFTTVPILQSFWNTFYVTVGALLVQLVVGSMAAYGIIMCATRFNRILGVVLLFAFTVPAQATLIPLYRTLVGVQLIDNLNGLIIMYSGGAIFCYFLIHGYMRTVPFEIIEAAKIDGANAFQVYWSVALPLIRPILVTVGVFQTMWVWNDFIYPTVFLSSPEKRTIVLQAYNAVGEFATNWPAFMTVSVIALVPMVIFFIFTQRHIVSGLLAGSVKG